MANEFKLSYNVLNSVKNNEFNDYSKSILNSINNFEKIKQPLSTDLYLSCAWSKIMNMLAGILKKRDSIDNWFTNYLENMKLLEESLPDKNYSLQNITTTYYSKNYENISVVSPDSNKYMSQNKKGEIIKPSPVISNNIGDSNKYGDSSNDMNYGAKSNNSTFINNGAYSKSNSSTGSYSSLSNGTYISKSNVASANKDSKSTLQKVTEQYLNSKEQNKPKPPSTTPGSKLDAVTKQYFDSKNGNQGIQINGNNVSLKNGNQGIQINGNNVSLKKTNYNGDISTSESNYSRPQYSSYGGNSLYRSSSNSSR